jgi:NAD(P)-dependent dehydrogenase (short-subunit alcohol dehydrogenase family)
MPDSSQPVALVTGGAQGIGKAIALRLEQDGFRVVIADIDEEVSRRVVAESSGEIRAITTDVADEAAVRTLIARISADFGQLDVLINNAGIARAHGVAMEQLELADCQSGLNAGITV